MRANSLQALPDTISRLVDVEVLGLSANSLTHLPHTIGHMRNLQVLIMSENALKALPNEIGGLEMLQTLDVQGNHLTQLPATIGRLGNLRTLDLSRNLLDSLPEEIGALRNLESLDCAQNRLHRLPRSIGNLRHLKRLSLSSSSSTALSLFAEKADVYYENPLEELPLEMRSLSELESFDVQYCQRLELPPELDHASPLAILDYYFGSRDDTSRPLNEAKVLVVGESEVGKTSLIKKLLRLGAFDPNEDQTHGVVTHRWDLPLRDRTVRLNVWDFGGQELMHATHQFFLTKRSLYLLVLDSRQNELQSRIEYWLKLIHIFGENSPVVVVCNKCDQQLMQLDWLGLQAKYPQIRRYVREVSCANGTGLQDVVAAICEEIAQLKHVDTAFPGAWFQVKQLLEDTDESCLPYSEYVEMCKHRGITEERQQRELIGFLNDLGVALHFHDHPILRDLSILNPLWVTTAVYRILTSSHLAQAQGVLTFSELGNLLNAVAESGFTYPPERQMFVIEMMRRFELLFDFEGQTNQKFLLPGLLPLEQPADVKSGWNDALGFRYQYGVLPASVISRFIVRMHQRIHDELYWRKGVVLESQDGDARARVQADFEDERIDIRIRGEPAGRRRFLQSIRDQFEAIHATIPGIGVDELMPLPEHPDVLIDYGRLLLFEKSGKTVDYEKVGGELVEIQIDELLEGVRHPAGLDVFISYAHEDVKWLDRFNKMLRPLVRDGRITTWSDQDISASNKWRDEIDRALRMCRAGLLLVSSEFLASDFIMEQELPYLLRARQAGRARIVIAVIGECFWNKTPLREIQAAHDAGQPLDGLSPSKRKAAIKSICETLLATGPRSERP